MWLSTKLMEKFFFFFLFLFFKVSIVNKPQYRDTHTQKTPSVTCETLIIFPLFGAQIASNTQ